MAGQGRDQGLWVWEGGGGGRGQPADHEKLGKRLVVSGDR